MLNPIRAAQLSARGRRTAKQAEIKPINDIGNRRKIDGDPCKPQP